MRDIRPSQSTADEATGAVLCQHDQECVDAIRRGDRKAFDTLYVSSYDALVAFGTHYLKSGAAAEDVVHDVFLSIWRRRDNWSPLGSVRAYLFTAVRNKALEQLRHLRIVDSFSIQRDIGIPTVSQDDPHAEVERDDRVTRLRQALDKLPERQAEALILRWYQGLTYPEIATVLGISPQATRTLILRVQLRLKTLLEDFI